MSILHCLLHMSSQTLLKIILYPLPLELLSEVKRLCECKGVARGAQRARAPPLSLPSAGGVYDFTIYSNYYNLVYKLYMH